jgi:ankyrin repeat protein
LDVVKELLERGANPNLRNSAGQTPLTFAAGRGFAEIVSLLLSKGGNPNDQDDNGDTPLHRAAFFGQTDVVEARCQCSPICVAWVFC